MPPIHIFTYGTLMYPKVFKRVTGRPFSTQPARVWGIKRRAIVGDVYPVAYSAKFAYGCSQINAHNCELQGRVYFNITPRALSKLDHYEGSLYERKLIHCYTAAGRKLRAHIYILRPKFLQRASQKLWRPEGFQSKQLQALDKYFAH